MSGQVHYDLVPGDVVTLPNGLNVVVDDISHDDNGVFFICTEDGEDVWYYTSILDKHDANAPLRDGPIGAGWK